MYFWSNPWSHTLRWVQLRVWCIEYVVIVVDIAVTLCATKVQHYLVTRTPSHSGVCLLPSLVIPLASQIHYTFVMETSSVLPGHCR